VWEKSAYEWESSTAVKLQRKQYKAMSRRCNNKGTKPGNFIGGASQKKFPQFFRIFLLKKYFVFVFLFFFLWTKERAKKVGIWKEGQKKKKNLMGMAQKK
jgi:hypothetical protein